MNTEEMMMKKYDQLYEKMATSGKIENMRLFGKVGRESMYLHGFLTAVMVLITLLKLQSVLCQKKVL